MGQSHAMVVIGGSAGALAAMRKILSIFPKNYPLPVVAAVHLHPLQDKYYLTHFSERCKLLVKEADDKGPICPGVVYFAPPNYHLLVEDNMTFSLSIDPKVNFSRPSIDVLFESAADACGESLIGVILTGANQDGAEGLRKIKSSGGFAIVQDPQTAESPYMPQAALEATRVDLVLPLMDIGKQLVELAEKTITGCS